MLMIKTHVYLCIIHDLRSCYYSKGVDLGRDSLGDPCVSSILYLCV